MKSKQAHDQTFPSPPLFYAHQAEEKRDQALKHDRENSIIDSAGFATMSGPAVGPDEEGGGAGALGATGTNAATGGGSASPLPAPGAAPTTEPPVRSIAELTSLLAAARIVASEAKSNIKHLSAELVSARARAGEEVGAQLGALEMRADEQCGLAGDCESGLQRQSIDVKDWVMSSLPAEGVRQFGLMRDGVLSSISLLLEDLQRVAIDASSLQMKSRHVAITVRVRVAYSRLIAIGGWLQRKGLMK